MCYHSTASHQKHMANAMLTIEIYKHSKTWCFTDEQRDLLHEPFVLGIPEIINTVLNDNKLYEEDTNYRILFADQDFPMSHGVLNKIRAESGGAWYKYNDQEGWLCPATLAFFADFPEQIHFRLEKV